MQLTCNQWVKFRLANKTQPSGAKKNKLAHAIFSKEGPNLIKPEVTRRPNVTPKIYKDIRRKLKENQF